MPTIDQQLTCQGFRCIANFDNLELIDRIDKNISGLQGYDYRVVPFHIAHGIRSEEPDESNRESHSIYAREPETESGPEVIIVDPVVNELTAQGFGQIAILSNYDMIDHIHRSIPNLQELDYRIIPFYIARGLKPEEVKDVDRYMHIVFAKVVRQEA